MFKKVTVFIISAGMLLSLSACASSNTDVPSTSAGNQTQSSSEDSSNNAEASTVDSATQSSTAQSTPKHIHVYSEATCTSPKTCSCGATAGVALGHYFSDATCTSPQICVRCGEINGSEVGHNYSDATCTSPKICTRCGETSGSALGHDYVDNKCSRCGMIDPESLPVGLETVYVIDSKYYEYKAGSFKDSFGNSYDGVHYYHDLYNSGNGKTSEPRSIHNLNGKFLKFVGSIVAAEDTNPDWSYFVNIYVDDVLQFSQTGFTKTTSKIDFNIDVSGVKKLTIKCGNEGDMGDYYMQIGIVNAQLYK